MFPEISTRNYDEMFAKLVIEYLYDYPFTKSESPDFFNNKYSIGIEVTRAYPNTYKKEIIQNKNTITPSVECLNALINSVARKMEKLRKYRKFKFNGLYIRTLINSNYFLGIPKAVLSEVRKEIEKELKNKSYDIYDVIIMEGIDFLAIWDYRKNDMFFRGDFNNVESFNRFNKETMERLKKK